MGNYSDVSNVIDAAANSADLANWHLPIQAI